MKMAGNVATILTCALAFSRISFDETGTFFAGAGATFFAGVVLETFLSTFFSADLAIADDVMGKEGKGGRRRR